MKLDAGETPILIHFVQRCTVVCDVVDETKKMPRRSGARWLPGLGAHLEPDTSSVREPPPGVK